MPIIVSIYYDPKTLFSEEEGSLSCCLGCFFSGLLYTYRATTTTSAAAANAAAWQGLLTDGIDTSSKTSFIGQQLNGERSLSPKPSSSLHQCHRRCRHYSHCKYHHRYSLPTLAAVIDNSSSHQERARSCR